MLNMQMTMAEAFHQVADTRRNLEAMVCGEERLTYGQLQDRSHALAWSLHHMGIQKGDKVAALLSPGPEFTCLFFALAEIGGIIVPLNPQLRSRSLIQILIDADPLLLITHHPIEEDLLSRVASIKHIILANGADGSFLSLKDMISAGKTYELPSLGIEQDDLLALLYTSGTTGAPKGTMHSHHSLITPIVASLKIRELWLRRPSLKKVGQTAKVFARYKIRLLRAVGHPQTFLSTIGWHTISGMELMLQALLMGDKIVAMPRFHPLEALQLVERERATILVAVPTAFQMMLNINDFDKYDTSSLLICGTGAMPCPPRLASQLQKRFGCAVHIGFGSTETAGAIAITSIGDSDEQQATTVGCPLPGMEVRIVDEQRRELPLGEIGEVACRSDSVMVGYYHATDETADTVDENGWYYTGDLAVMDAEGYLHIVGRKKDMIIRGGQNIYPVEIEEYLTRHPKIHEAAVVGVPSGVGGEEVWAFIILKEDVEMSAKEVLDSCRIELESYKIPNKVRFVTDFPRSETGKPQKYKIRADILREMVKGNEND
jgi:acyl-CoA synthetase (AMP-forming)/AMP-acid ligase II